MADGYRPDSQIGSASTGSNGSASIRSTAARHSLQATNTAIPTFRFPKSLTSGERTANLRFGVLDDGVAVASGPSSSTLRL